LSTTSTETFDYSIGFGFAALIYVSPSISTEFYIDFGDFHYEISIFIHFGLGKMPPKHCQPNALYPTPAGNVYKALIDLPHSGTNATFNRRDRKVDGIDNNSIVHTF
jgi:hypothetical protein